MASMWAGVLPLQQRVELAQHGADGAVGDRAGVGGDLAPAGQPLVRLDLDEDVLRPAALGARLALRVHDAGLRRRHLHDPRRDAPDLHPLPPRSVHRHCTSFSITRHGVTPLKSPCRLTLEEFLIKICLMTAPGRALAAGPGRRARSRRTRRRLALRPGAGAAPAARRHPRRRDRGARLELNNLAGALQVSHMPVREALHLLVMEGLAVRDRAGGWWCARSPCPTWRRRPRHRRAGGPGGAPRRPRHSSERPASSGCASCSRRSAARRGRRARGAPAPQPGLPRRDPARLHQRAGRRTLRHQVRNYTYRGTRHVYPQSRPPAGGGRGRARGDRRRDRYPGCRSRRAGDPAPRRARSRGTSSPGSSSARRARAARRRPRGEGGARAARGRPAGAGRGARSTAAGRRWVRRGATAEARFPGAGGHARGPQHRAPPRRGHAHDAADRGGLGARSPAAWPWSAPRRRQERRGRRRCAPIARRTGS